ncbi:hypothetical protein AEAC466_15320 [Asticcacaulis sp. AC466]|uniref:DUF1697 domain-containing protein n=1 Tax=Asticcacaulis sp. AC466 TaxID=1282362 RepID=UPI0003C3C7D0|nr:DUF1697 domain-containing protein [Asticcacaulis sp. AC466]ESQ82879.1 hypothetical protein AEAC466_15320 [Asticcacaulis sp. AC466]
MSKIWIGLFRGVNVGGRKMVMKNLVTALEAAGLQDVRTYIQSGNVLFRSALSEQELETLIDGVVEKTFGYHANLHLVTLSHLETVLKDNPYRNHKHTGKAQHVFFFKAPPSHVDRELMDSLKADSEAYEITDELMYLYAPDGIGRSKLVEKIGKAIKADMTARNLNTVETLRDMAAELSA